MKKLILLAAFIIVAGATLGQTLQKGNLVGLHVGTIILDPDVTYNQWKDFMINKYIPEFEKQFQGDIKMYLAEGDRGDEENCISIFWVFKSMEVRDKYFTQEGSSTELFKSKFEKIQPISEDASNWEHFPENITLTG
ncbi:hypothetical protein ES705_08859 [subsurface metagenome]